MRVSLVVPVIASILVLGVLGLSQDAWAGGPFLQVTDQFGDVHFVDEGMFSTSEDAGCMGGEPGSLHHHADNGMGFVTSVNLVEISDPAPTMCGYGLVGGDLMGTVFNEFTLFIDTTLDCSRAPDGFESTTRVIVIAPNGEVLVESDPVACRAPILKPIMFLDELNWVISPNEPEDFEVLMKTDISNNDEEKSCDKKLRVDKDGEINGKSRCGLKMNLGAVIIRILGLILVQGPF